MKPSFCLSCWRQFLYLAVLSSVLAFSVVGCSNITGLTDRMLGNVEMDPATRDVIAKSEANDNSEYKIGAEDLLEISVWKEDNLKKEVLVRPDGGISFPLAGNLQVAGKTTDQVRLELSQKIQKYIPDPAVSVSVLKAAHYKVYVIGRVNKPGDLTNGSKIDVLQALSMAGGLTPYASGSDIRVVRKFEGKNLVIPFNYTKVQRGEDLDENIILNSGDVVIVP